MKKLNKISLAMGVALAATSTISQAGSFQTITSTVIGTEAATTGTLSATVAADTVVVELGSQYNQDNRLTLTLQDGATFADSTYVLEQSVGGAGIGDTSEWVLITSPTAGASELVFRLASTAVDTTNEFILSGSSVVGQSVAVTVPALAAGSEIDLDAEGEDTIGIFDNFDVVELFGYANQFTAAVDTVADATVDVNNGRLTFTGSATTDTIAIDFSAATVGTGVTLTDADEVDIVLSGDMSTIRSITMATGGQDTGTFTIDEDAGTATLSVSASDAFNAGAANTSGVITATVWGSGALATRSFTVQADLDFESETDKNLVAENTSAGQWDINGLQAKVSHLSLNASGFISWLKVVNEGTASAEITADIIWTLADGTEGSVTAAALGSVDAGGVYTVSEAAIVEAMGSPTQLADVSMTVTVAGQVDLVHLVAEKKASDGRLPIPVYYNTTGANARSWVQ